MAIDTREELVDALHVACEVEHSLLVQYLYAGLSIKRGLDEGLTTHEQRLLRDWQGRIYQIAREEMGHLGIACNLLAAIGAAPKLGRRPIPSEVGYFPFPFDLLPFGDEALYRFLVFELPRDFPLPPPPGADLGGFPRVAESFAPEPVEYEFVGELYAKIAEGFQAIPEAELFLGPPAAQAQNDWSDPSLDIHGVVDQNSALEAIRDIIEDGEGTSQSNANSHYATFLGVRQRYFEEGRFEGARRVPRNPATRTPVGGPDSVTLIANPESRRLVELCNTSYGVMLLLLQHYFSLAPRSQSEAALRRALQQASQRIMSVAVRPLAEETTRAPLGDPEAPDRAGPSFEIYTEVSLSPFPEARLPIALERLNDLVLGCAELGQTLPRVAAIGETVAILRADLAIEGRSA